MTSDNSPEPVTCPGAACGHQNPPGAEFCAHCGQRLRQVAEPISRPAVAAQVSGSAAAQICARLTGRDYGLFAVLCVPYLWLVQHFWFLTDDAYISFRYARYWATGHGLRYNLGNEPPVEGYSNFLWVALGALIERLRLDLLFWAPFISALCGVGMLFLFYRVVRLRFGLSRLLASLATAFLGLSMPYVIWSTSGLETMPFSLLLLATFERLILRRAGIAAAQAGLLALALALIRTEGIAWALVLVPLTICSRWWQGQKCKQAIFVYLAIVGAGYALYFAGRYWYFGQLVPSAAYAKGGLAWDRLWRGFSYVAVQYLTCLPLFAIVPGTVAGLRRKRLAVGIPVVLMALAFPCYSIVVSGDFMTFGRFLVPGLAFTALLFAWWLQDIGEHSLVRRVAVVALGAGGVCLSLLPGWDVHLVPTSVRARFHFRHNLKQYKSELNQWKQQRDNAYRWAWMGQALNLIARPGDSLVFGAIGAIGYHSDLFIFDRNGLVTRAVTTRPSQPANRRSPGHDKYVPLAFFLPSKPTFLLAVGLPEVSPDALARAVAAYGRKAHKLNVQEQYVPDFFKVLGPGYTADPRYLIVYRRIDASRSAAGAWRELQQKLDAFARSGQVQTVKIP